MYLHYHAQYILAVLPKLSQNKLLHCIIRQCSGGMSVENAAIPIRPEGHFQRPFHGDTCWDQLSCLFMMTHITLWLESTPSLIQMTVNTVYNMYTFMLIMWKLAAQIWLVCKQCCVFFFQTALHSIFFFPDSWLSLLRALNILSHSLKVYSSCSQLNAHRESAQATVADLLKGRNLDGLLTQVNGCESREVGTEE